MTRPALLPIPFIIFAPPTAPPAAPSRELPTAQPARPAPTAKAAAPTRALFPLIFLITSLPLATISPAAAALPDFNSSQDISPAPKAPNIPNSAFS